MTPLYQSAPSFTILKEIYFGSDHAAWALKEQLMEYTHLKFPHLTLTDCGPKTDASCDYPEFAWEVAQNVGRHPYSLGVLLCGTGIGVSLVANQHPQIRAALVHNQATAKMARQHNDAQIICMGARQLSSDEACAMLGLFIHTSFDGEHPEGERHIRRLNQMYQMQTIKTLH